MVATKVSNLLQKILRDPNSPAIPELANFIVTEPGYADFCESLRSNDVLSYIYLKMSISQWIESNINQAYYSLNFFNFLLSSANPNSRIHLCEYFEKLSLLNRIPLDFIKELINKKQFDILDSIYKKFTILHKSNELYSEIIFNIENISPLLEEIYFNETTFQEVQNAFNQKLQSIDQSIKKQDSNNFLINNFSPTTIQFVSQKISSKDFYNDHLISILFSLIFQDIHPFFEDNSEKIFKVFLILFDEINKQKIIIKIFDLFITKYPDCTNYELLILALTRINSFEIDVINTLTKAFEYKPVHANLIIKMLQNVLISNRLEEDTYSYTKDVFKGFDERASTHKLIKLINPSIYYFSGEVAIFVAYVLKYQDENLLLSCEQIINSSSSDLRLVFSTFYYLITVSHFCKFNYSYLNTDLKYICLKYISSSLKSIDHFYRDYINKYYILSTPLILSHNSSVESVHNSPYIPPSTNKFEFISSKEENKIEIFTNEDKIRLLDFIKKNLCEHCEEFSAEAFFRIVKDNDILLSTELYDFLTGLFTKIDKIGIKSLNYLFDVYIGLSIKLKKYNLQLIEYILNNELIDLYNLGFLYLSVLIQEVSIPSGFITNLLSQDALWNERSLNLSMCLISISAFKKGIIGTDIISKFFDKLEPNCKTILLCKCGILNQVLNTPVDQFLVNNLFDISVFKEIFIEKKFARMVIKKLFKEGKVQKVLVNEILQRNIRSIEFEFTLHSITCYFEL